MKAAPVVTGKIPYPVGDFNVPEIPAGGSTVCRYIGRTGRNGDVKNRNPLIQPGTHVGIVTFSPNICVLAVLAGNVNLFDKS